MYGKDVKGKLNAVLCLNHKDWYYWRRGQYTNQNFKKCQNITREVYNIFTFFFFSRPVNEKWCKTNTTKL